MRLTHSMVLRPIASFSVAALATALLLSGCGSSGGGSGTGGTGGKRDSGMVGSGGSADAAPIPGTGGAPGTGGIVGTGGAIALDAGLGGSTGADVKPPSVDVGIDGGIVAADVPPDNSITPSDAADAATIDAAIVSEVGAVDSSQSGGSCPAGKWDQLIDINTLSGLAADKDGNLFLAASVYTTVNFGSGQVTSAGSADLAIAKLDPSTGKAAWTKTFGDDSDQVAANLALANSGQVGVHGTFTGSMTVKDTITNPGADPIDFVAALDSDGTSLWAKAFDTAAGAIVAIAGNPAQDTFAICGYAMGAATDLVPTATATSDGMEDILVAKINATTGSVVWSREISGLGTQMCTAIAMDSAGNVFAGGTYNGTLDLGLGAFSPAPPSSAQVLWLAKLDSAKGTTLSANSWGNSRKQVLYTLALDGSGNPAIAGSLKGAVTFGSKTLTAGGGSAVDGGASASSNADAFAVKLDGNLNPLWASNWGDSLDQDVRSAAFDSKGDLILGGSLVGTIDLGNGTTLVAATGPDSYLNPLSDVFWMKVRGDTGAGLCGQRFGDAYAQQVDLLTVSRATSGPQADAVTLGGYFQGVLDFGLASGQLVAGVPGTGSANHTATFLLQVTP